MSRSRCFIALLLLLVCLACSLPPQRPVTRDALMRTRIYSNFVIAESPDEVLDVLNRDGEVVLEAKRVIRNQEYLVHIKILATTGGLEVLDYDR